MNHVQRRIKLAQDSRISLISEYLRSIKAIKYFAWEDPIVERVQEARAKELKEIWRLVVLNILIGVSTFPPLPLLLPLRLHRASRHAALNIERRGTKLMALIANCCVDPRHHVANDLWPLRRSGPTATHGCGRIYHIHSDPDAQAEPRPGGLYDPERERSSGIA